MPESPYAANVKSQYEELGRFVEAFEMMVAEVREACIGLFSLNLVQKRELEIVFHHRIMTAQPLFEIFRASMVERLADDDFRKRNDMDDLDRVSFIGVLRAIAGEYSKLINKRNSLLHGTWFVGFTSNDDPDSSEFEVIKYDVAAEGLRRAALPKDVASLSALRARCEEVRSWVGVLYSCFPGGGAEKIKERFCLEGETWVRLWPSRGTLPSKSE